MRLLQRPLRAGGAAVLGLATIALTGAFAGVIGSIANAAHLAGLVVGVAFGVFRF